MNISYNWLKDLVEFDLSPNDLAEKLTSVGLAVEGVHAHEDDFVLDIDLTSNRPDCLSHLGTAREISAIADGQLLMPKSKVQSSKSEARIEDLTSVEALDADLCPRYTARIIKGVKVAPSPEWLVKRLEAVGERSINNIADITNYVMHELGQPLHAFDFDKLAGKKIVVRRAEKGEKMKTLDAVERTFDESMLLICDAEKPVAIGGLMGGEDSGISDKTVDVLIEAAHFKRENVRQTSRKLGLATEASYRFERGTDVENVLRASNRCVELICEIAGGAATETAIDIYPAKRAEIVVSLRPERIKVLTGLRVEATEIKRILTALGFETDGGFANSGDENMSFIAPSWRHDIEREEDLVEEIARHVGYNEIAEELPPAFGAGAYQPNEFRKKAVRSALQNLGFDEALSYSFVDTRHDETFEFLANFVNETSEEKFISLQDSIIEGAIRMRPTLLVGLLEAVRENLNHGNRSVKLFEIGKVFANSNQENELPIEKESFAVILTGGEILANHAEQSRELGFYDAKAAVEAAVSAMNLPQLKFQAAKIKHLRDGQAAEILLNSERVGTIGKLADEIAAGYKFRQTVFIGEIDLQKLLATAPEAVLYSPLPKYPAILRDVSFLVKRANSFGEIRDFIIAQKFDLCRSVDFVGVYEGKGIADDERSLTLRFEYRSDFLTLQDAEAEAVHAKIVSAVENQFGAKLRF